MKQRGIGEVQFVATRDPFVCMTVVGVTGRVAMALDRREATQLFSELGREVVRAFGLTREQLLELL